MLSDLGARILLSSMSKVDYSATGHNTNFASTLYYSRYITTTFEQESMLVKSNKYW